MSLQKVREFLALLLLALLPFHAFLVTVGTKLIAGAGHAPLGWLAIWKEGVVGIIVLLALCDRAVWRGCKRWDAIDVCVLILLAIGVALGLRDHALLTPAFVYGVRYDLVLPLVFVMLRRVEWSTTFVPRALQVLLWSAMVVVVMGVVMLVLPVSALQVLGYSDLHSLYVSGGALAPFQQIGDTGIRRMQSVMSGPNQLGLWLLLPLATAMLRRRWVFVAPIALAIVLTFSRAAWLAAGVLVVCVAWKEIRPSRRARVLGLWALVCVLCVTGILAVSPTVITRVTSTKNHIERPLAALRSIIAHPLGQGLGTAGPATNHGRSTCIDLPSGSDVTWAKVHPDLCVFLDGKQVQPAEPCLCPFLPENWYLQIGVELGAAGLCVYLLLCGLLLRKTPRGAVLLGFLGVCIAGVFLHSFEDFGVAATLWLLIAATNRASAQSPHR